MKNKENLKEFTEKKKENLKDSPFLNPKLTKCNLESYLGNN